MTIDEAIDLCRKRADDGTFGESWRVEHAEIARMLGEYKRAMGLLVKCDACLNPKDANQTDFTLAHDFCQLPSH